MKSTAPDEIAVEDMLDLERYTVDQRAERLERTFHVLRPGESVWVCGHGDPLHYERFLAFRFPGEVEWVQDLARGGRWVARITRAAD